MSCAGTELYGVSNDVGEVLVKKHGFDRYFYGLRETYNPSVNSRSDCMSPVNSKDGYSHPKAAKPLCLVGLADHLADSFIGHTATADGTTPLCKREQCCSLPS